MARLIKCPRCQAQMDVTNVAGGATVRCGDCNSMIRVPSGTYPKAEPPAPAPAKKAGGGGGRTTALFRKMSGARGAGMMSSVPRGGGGGGGSRGNNTPLIIGGVVGGLAVVAVLIFLLAGPKKNDKTTTDKKAPATASATPEPDPEPVKENSAKQPDKKNPEKIQKSGGTYKAPDNFVPGAEKHARSVAKQYPEIKVEESLLAIYDDLARKGDVASILKEDWKYLPCMILRFLSDDEKIAKTSFQAMSDLCVKRKISAGRENDPFKNPIHLHLVNSHEYRGGDYVSWADWWNNKNNQLVVADWKDAGGNTTNLPPMDAESADWNKLVSELKEGGFDDVTTPAGLAAQKMKRMGRAGLVKLIGMMDPEDLPTLRVIVSVLNHLTGQNKPLPTAGTKGQAKSEWETWLKNN